MASEGNKNSAVNKLYETIKYKFQEDGVLDEMRCLLQSKMVTMMNGDNAAAKPKPLAGEAASTKDPRMQILHQLIMEYLQWHGYQYTSQMFAVEVGVENKKPMREFLEGLLGTFKHKEMPILLEMVVERSKKHIQNEEATDNLDYASN